MSVPKLVEKTRELSVATDVEWEKHYDAIVNLRVLNKFHFSDLCKELIDNDQGKWAGSFIGTQVSNLRSHNSRNSMELFYELFAYNNEDKM